MEEDTMGDLLTPRYLWLSDKAAAMLLLDKDIPSTKSALHFYLSKMYSCLWLVLLLPLYSIGTGIMDLTLFFHKLHFLKRRTSINKEYFCLYLADWFIFSSSLFPVSLPIGSPGNAAACALCDDSVLGLF